MEGLPQSEKSNFLEKRGNRKWRKNAELKVPLFGSGSNERLLHTDDVEHKKVWHQLVSSEMEAKSTESANEKPRRAGSEAHSLHGGILPEAIGQVLITAAEAQSNVVRKAEQITPSAEQARSISIDKHIETMSREDLFELSSKIVVEGSNLLHMYETHLIGEQALRRLVAEHLRGGNLHEALREEILQHEIDFERDPQMRDHSHQPPSPSDNATNNTVDDAMTMPADEKNVKDNKRDQKNIQLTDDSTNHPKVYRSRALDITLSSIIVILLLLVLVLVLTR